MGRVRKTVSLDEADLEYIRDLASKNGTNFSEGLRYIVKSHREIFDGSIILPNPKYRDRMLSAVEEE